METEWTYLMLTSKLMEMIGNDGGIPKNIKTKILNDIDCLQQMIECYSA